MNRKTLKSSIAVLLFGLAAGCGLLGKKETVITISQTPAPVRASIEKVTAGNKIKQIEKIEKDGKVVYEVEYIKDGKEEEAFFTEDGKSAKSP